MEDIEPKPHERRRGVPGQVARVGFPCVLEELLVGSSVLYAIEFAINEGTARGIVDGIPRRVEHPIALEQIAAGHLLSTMSQSASMVSSR